MKLARVELSFANDFVWLFHRHHKPVTGHRFSLGAETNDGRPVGVVIVGRPVAQKTDQITVAEVTRLCTDGTPNACSFLYAAAARAAKALGFSRIQTFILKEESGVSLVASGWTKGHTTKVGGKGWQSRPGRRTDQPQGQKVLYYKTLV